MLSSVLPFTPEMAALTSKYCTEHSEDVSAAAKEIWDWSCANFEDAHKMSSPLQNATFKWLAEHQEAKRVLEIGCYTGYSALAWYEATESTKAEIISLELDPKMIAASRRNFDKYGLNDRVRIIEGPAGESLKTLTGEFDIIFVDANKDGYEEYVKTILDKKLLSPKGFIMADNVFARGMTIHTDSNPTLPPKAKVYWTECGKALQSFCRFCRDDPRIDTILLPLYDGITLAKWKPSFLQNGTN